MVPGRAAQPRLEPLALSLSARRVSVSGPDRRQRVAEQVPAGVRAAGHRDVRRGQVLDHRSALRQGQRRRPADDRAGDQRRPRDRDAARAADRLVPQHLVVGRRRAQAEDACGGRFGGRHRSPVRRPDGAAGRPRAGRDDADRGVLRERDQRPEAVRLRAAHAVPEGRHQRPRGQRGGHRQSGAHGHQVLVLVPGDGRARRNGRAAAAAAPAARPCRQRDRERPARRAVRPGDRPAQGRGRRVLRRPHPGRGVRRRGAGDAPGVRRVAVEQAAVLLRRRPLAGRRPDPADPPGASA